MFVHISFPVKKPRDLPSVYRHHFLVVLLSKVHHGAKNADVTRQATSLPNFIVDSIDLTFENFTLFDLDFELFRKSVFAVGV